MRKISNKFLHTTIIVFAVVLCVTSVLKTYPTKKFIILNEIQK